MKERLAQWIVWHLPRRVVYWAVIRAAAKFDDYPAEKTALEIAEVWR